MIVAACAPTSNVMTATAVTVATRSARRASEGATRSSGTSGAAGCATAAAAAAAASDGWYYVKDEREHGPFTLDAMRQWAVEGYFGAELPVRCGAAGKVHAFGSSKCAAAKSAADADARSGGAPLLEGAEEMVPTLRVRCAGCNLDVGVVDTTLDVYLFKDVLPSFA